MPNTIKALPEGYREVYRLVITDQDKLMWLNILSLALLIPFVLLMVWWAQAVIDLRGIRVVMTLEAIPGVFYFLLVILVLPLHELIHGFAIQWVGHRPKYGAKFTDVGRLKIPYVLYATADNAYFRRYEFIVVALAPVVVITLLGLVMVYLLPDALALYIGAAVVINGTGAVGDIWMTWVVLRYPPDTLVLDEADSIRVYATDSVA